MVTAKKYLKLWNLNETETNKMIDKMSEDDCKHLLKVFFKDTKAYIKKSSLALLEQDKGYSPDETGTMSH